MMKKLLLAFMALVSITQLFAWDGTNSQPANGDGSQLSPFPVACKVSHRMFGEASRFVITKRKAPAFHISCK